MEEDNSSGDCMQSGGILRLRISDLRGAQAASLLSSAACRRLPRVARISLIERSKSFSAGCRKRQASSLCSPEVRTLPPRGIDGFWLCSWRRFQPKNCFAFLHQIETIARDGFQVSHVSLEEVDLASLTREQTLLPVYLLLELVDFGAALHQFLVRWNKQAHDHEPDREDQQNAKNSVKSLPDGGFATRAKIGVGLIHLADFTAVLGFVTKFFFDSQQLIVFRDAIAAAK